jgi:hypothetical protein
METAADVVWVVDAWDDDAQESYVKVFSTAEKAERDLESWGPAEGWGGRRPCKWPARREGHDLYAGVLKRKIL